MCAKKNKKKYFIVHAASEMCVHTNLEKETKYLYKIFLSKIEKKYCAIKMHGKI